MKIPKPRLSGRAKSRTNFAVPHIFAAAYSARRAVELERVNAGKFFGDFYEEILWNVSASVLFSVAALEADANEIFIDAERLLPVLDIEFVNEIWKLIEMRSILDKYEMALFLKNACYKRGFANGCIDAIPAEWRFSRERPAQFLPVSAAF